jgi:hypothetical protein
VVTWTTYAREHSFIFTGGIVMTANRPFPPLPELEAVKTRIEYMQMVVSDNELTALMRRVSLNGYKRNGEVMDPSECMEVCEFIITQCRGLRRAMDMRMLINSFQDFLQYRAYESGCHWHDLVATRIKERPIALEEARTHHERSIEKANDLAIAKEIFLATQCRQERLRMWKEKTGKGESTLYRHLKSVQAEDPSVLGENVRMWK